MRRNNLVDGTHFHFSPTKNVSLTLMFCMTLSLLLLRFHNLDTHTNKSMIKSPNTCAHKGFSLFTLLVAWFSISCHVLSNVQLCEFDRNRSSARATVSFAAAWISKSQQRIKQVDQKHCLG